MEEIRLNYSIMEECIQELTSLQSECVQMEYPKAFESGKAVTGIWQLVQDYGQFFVSMEALIGETTRYLTQMVHDFKETDENMARELKKGVKSEL